MVNKTETESGTKNQAESKVPGSVARKSAAKNVEPYRRKIILIKRYKGVSLSALSCFLFKEFYSLELKGLLHLVL